MLPTGTTKRPTKNSTAGAIRRKAVTSRPAAKSLNRSIQRPGGGAARTTSSLTSARGPGARVRRGAHFEDVQLVLLVRLGASTLKPLTASRIAITATDRDGTPTERLRSREAALRHDPQGPCQGRLCPTSEIRLAARPSVPKKAAN